jgi:hypothetical protein
MTTFEELSEHHHKITALSKVLECVIKERSLCDNDVTCDLFFQYVQRVKEHLDIEDKQLYAPLLNRGDRAISDVARRFLSGSVEIKRVFDQYTHKWCARRALIIKDHPMFVKETRDMFRLVAKRIQDETEKMYPLIRKVSSEMPQRTVGGGAEPPRTHAAR